MNPDLTSICNSLREERRSLKALVRTRVAIENRILSWVAVSLGFDGLKTENEREKAFDEAREHIAGVVAGEITSPCKMVITTHQVAIDFFNKPIADILKKRRRLASQLPAAQWVEHPDQRGFALDSLANVIGECGNLNHYASPGRLWSRMGCAPYTRGAETLMGSTWRKKKNHGLSDAEWTEYGYSPQRCTVRYLIGWCLTMHNKNGPYRRRYDEKKESARKLHPDWTDAHLDNHAKLLAAKLLLKNLWIVWTDGGKNCHEIADGGSDGKVVTDVRHGTPSAKTDLDDASPIKLMKPIAIVGSHPPSGEDGEESSETDSGSAASPDFNSNGRAADMLFETDNCCGRSSLLLPES